MEDFFAKFGYPKEKNTGESMLHTIDLTWLYPLDYSEKILWTKKRLKSESAYSSTIKTSQNGESEEENPIPLLKEWS